MGFTHRYYITPLQGLITIADFNNGLHPSLLYHALAGLDNNNRSQRWASPIAIIVSPCKGFTPLPSFQHYKINIFHTFSDTDPQTTPVNY